VLTPEDIQSREFLVSLRGYDRDEVHAFLDEVAEDFASLLGRSGGAASPAKDDTPATDDADTVADVDGDAEVVEEATPEPVVEPAPEPAPPADAIASFAAIGAETQRILEAAHAAGEEIRRKAETEAESLRESRLKDAQDEVDGLREQAAAIRKQIDDLEGRRDELANRLRQAKETVDLALLEVEEIEADAEPADANTSVLAAEAADDDAEEGTEAD